MVLGICFILGCKSGESQKNLVLDDKERGPDRIKVEHILIAFEDSLPGKKVSRSQTEAEKIAKEVFEKLKSEPERFSDYVKTYSDDKVPGYYSLSNFGIKTIKDELERSTMPKAFGDISFQLKPGEMALVPYDKDQSPYGYEIIKRIE